MQLPARRHVPAVPHEAEISGDRLKLRHRRSRQGHLAGRALRLPRRCGEAFRPDIIITQDHCEVCAASLKDVEAALCEWVGRQVEIVSLRPNSLADIWEDIAKVARALGRERQGERLVEQLKARMASIAERSCAARTRPRVAMIEWLDPLMAGGNWMPELVQMAGGENLFGVAGQPSPRLDWDQIVIADPDLIVVHPCGFDITRTLQEMPLLGRRPGWPGLKAVQCHRIFVADGNHYFNRPGPRIVESLEMLAELFHPELFPSRYEGEGWVRYEAEPRVRES
jgi:iron complex transport system substrate-binding protein